MSGAVISSNTSIKVASGNFGLSTTSSGTFVLTTNTANEYIEISAISSSGVGAFNILIRYSDAVTSFGILRRSGGTITNYSYFVAVGGSPESTADTFYKGSGGPIIIPPLASLIVISTAGGNPVNVNVFGKKFINSP